jgi:hypothetical protein
MHKSCFFMPYLVGFKLKAEHNVRYFALFYSLWTVDINGSSHPIIFNRFELFRNYPSSKRLIIKLEISHRIVTVFLGEPS